MTSHASRFRSCPCALAALLASGCASNYNAPPTALGSEGLLANVDPASRVVVVGRFDNPGKSPVRWRDVGAGMSEALSQALLNEGRFEVWSNQRLAEGVEDILEGPTSAREKELGKLEEKHRNVRFVITGQVTDFHHTGELPSDMRRRSTFGGSKEEAIVAVRFTMVDLRAQRVLVVDHVYGTAPTGKDKTRELYKDVAFGSYLFWNSPMGRAAEQSLRQAMTRINEVTTAVAELRIIKQLEQRKVVVSGQSTSVLRPGQEFFICRYDEHEARLVPVNDRVLDQPLRARILTANGTSATAWLIGERPVEIDLRGAELRSDLPRGDEPTVATGGAKPAAPEPPRP